MGLSTLEWARQHFARVELGNIKRTDRLVSLANALARNPGVSIAKTGSSWYDTKATYKLLRDSRMKPDIVQSNHRLIVTKEIEQSDGDVLLIEDGSEFEWNHKDPIRGLGPVGSGRDCDQGFLMQSVLAVERPLAGKYAAASGNTSRSPVRLLGLLDQQFYIRPPKRKDPKRRRDTTDRLETDLWLETLERLPKFAKRQGDIIRVCDRAADIYEVISETERANLGYVIRARHNRTVEDAFDEDGNSVRLFDHLRSQNAVTSKTVHFRARGSVPAQTVTLNISFCQTKTKAPSRPGCNMGQLPPLEYTVVRVWGEMDGSEPIEWFLLTNLDIRNVEDLQKVVEIYATRWIIEEFHKALKSGLKAEDLQLESGEALIAAIALMSIVALRLVDLRELGRLIPDAPACASGLDDFELKVLSHRIKRDLKTVRDVVLAVGRLGGHLGRKRDGMPGTKTLWLGMSELINLVEGAKIGMLLMRS